MTAGTIARPRRRRRPAVVAGPLLRYVGLSLFLVPWILLPLWLLVVNSLKPLQEAGLLGLALPKKWAAAENFRTVIKQGNYLHGLRNSLLVIVPVLLLTLLLGSMAAWAYARTRSVTMKVCYYLPTLSILLPAAMIPTIYVLSRLGINGSRLGYGVALVATRLGIVVFLTTGFIKALPEELEEAARIDGSSRWRVYWHIILPMVRPILFVAGVILVITTWNDFFFAFFLLQGSSRATLPLSLYQFASATTNTMNWNLVFAHVILTSLPLILAYVVAQKRVIGGLIEGGVKG